MRRSATSPARLRRCGTAAATSVTAPSPRPRPAAPAPAGGIDQHPRPAAPGGPRCRSADATTPSRRPKRCPGRGPGRRRGGRPQSPPGAAPRPSLRRSAKCLPPSLRPSPAAAVSGTVAWIGTLTRSRRPPPRGSQKRPSRRAEGMCSAFALLALFDDGKAWCVPNAVNITRRGGGQPAMSDLFWC